MRTKRFVTFFACLALCISAGAQFYTTGDDPGGLKWYSITSKNFKVIYSEGLDSLARVYGNLLEKYRTPVGASIGVKPNELYRKPLPVVLHSYVADANGVVTWAPHRMDLYTGPDAHYPDVLQWDTNLAMHESRHVAQMQAGRFRGYGLFNWLSGDLFGGAFSALYAGPALFEGDAVVTETALSNSGRGRSADFLEYYRASFAEGKYRNWYQWRYGSLDKFTPNYYATGYMLIGGVRYTYDDPLFTKDFYDRLIKRRGRGSRKGTHHFPILNLQKTVKSISGKNLRRTWDEICDTQNAIWTADEAARGPFTQPVQLTPDTRRFTEYLMPTAVGNDIIAVRHSITSTATLVKIDSLGEVKALRPFAGTAYGLQYSEPLHRIFWSESIPDRRWSLAASSRIYSADPSGRNAQAITTEGRFYNPAPSPDDSRIAVTEYPVTGGSAIAIIDASDGAVLEHYPAPAGMQVVEAGWMGKTLTASAITLEGYGIYSVTDGYATLLKPQPAKIKQLRPSGDKLLFVSDRNGVNELYSLDAYGNVLQMSNNRQGASDFIAGRDSLTFAALTTEGRYLYKNTFEPVQVDYGELYHYPVADKLSRQEKSLGYAGMETSEFEAGTSEDAFSAPERYGKLTHLMRFHSWLPLFVDYDDISSISFETISTMGLLGATAFFQNNLGTSSGLIGYSAAANSNGWIHGAHAKFSYSGLYPVIELSANLDNNDRSVYGSRLMIASETRTLSLAKTYTEGLNFSGNAKVYIPFNFSSGGWFRGVIPQISATFSNAGLNTSEVFTVGVPVIGWEKSGMTKFFAGSEEGPVVPMIKLNAGIRGYTMLGTASSGIYPRWGIGAEAGYSNRPGDRRLFTPNAYTHVYGYLPGLFDTHSINVSATAQYRFQGGISDSYIIVLPRGITASDAQTYIARKYPVQSKFCFDYIMPFLPLDLAWLGPLAYIKNLELGAHFDYALYGGKGARAGDGSGANLFSAGGRIVAKLGNFLWLPYETRFGVSYSYSDGSLWNDLVSNDIDLGKHHTFSLVFSVDL